MKAKTITVDLTKEQRLKLGDIRARIEEQVPFVDLKPYSHNIISLCLRQISMEFSKHEANNTIDEFDLERLGWRKEK